MNWRFLIIGLGSIGRRHMTNLAQRYPNAHFTVLRHSAAPDPLCDHLGATVTADRAAALSGEYDLAVISSPSANHIDSLPQLIIQGTPLLVEKPIVTSLADCDRIDALLKTAPPALRVAAFNFRHLPVLQHMRMIIQSGELGRIVRANFTAGQWLPDWRPGTDYRAGYSANAMRGGGVELDLVHEIDLARWFFGEMELRFALGGRLSDLDLQANDVATIVMTGTSRRAGWNGPIVQVSLDYVSRHRLRHYEIVGDRGGLCWDIAGTLDRITPQGRERVLCVPDGFNVAASYIEMIEAIESALQGADWPSNLQTLADGVLSTRLALAARDYGSKQGQE